VRSTRLIKLLITLGVVDFAEFLKGSLLYGVLPFFLNLQFF